MRVVLDTNVLVAGLLSPFGPCGEVVRMVSSGELSLCLDARVLSEYSEVLRRPKFGFDDHEIAALLDYVGHGGFTVASSPLPRSLPDADDEPFLAVALGGGAEYLITGNQAHYPPGLREGIAVVSPAEFLEAYRQRQDR
jgi:putative PIN family toxin of toxin-antitoxin system